MSAAERAGTRRLPAWVASAGVVLLLAGLLRWSVTAGWDTWCSGLAVSGGLTLVTWAVGQRAALRQRVGTRGARYGRHAVASVVLLGAGLMLVNFLASRHNARWDTTGSGLFTLAPETRQVIRTLPRELHLLAFFPVKHRGQAAELLRRYSAEGPRLTYELIDPDQDPERAHQYGVTTPWAVVVETVRGPHSPAPSGKPVRVEPDAEQAQRFSLSEEKLTNALLKVTRGGSKTIYFVEGHGEADFDNTGRDGYSRAREALQGQAFLVKRLLLAREPRVPKDCSVLILAGPGKELFPSEEKAIRDYLQGGGKLFAMVDPRPGASLSHLLRDWGVEVRNDLVLDTSGGGRAYGAGPALPLVKDYDRRHPITREFRTATLFPLARSLAAMERASDAEVWPLAQTSAESFAEPYDGQRKRARFDPATDRKGPLLLALAVTRPTRAGAEARLVVTGDSDFVSNGFFDRAGDGDFFLGCVSWLAEEEALIALHPRPREDRRVSLTEAEARGVFWLVVALPLSALAAGLFVQWRRR